MGDNRDKFVHPSLASLPESDLVKRLLDHPFNRRDLLGVRGIPSDAINLDQVAMLGLPGKPEGDIDLLAWASGKPDEATAFEIKRFKVVVRNDGSAQPNKLHEFAKGVRQANLLAAIGFSRVYLWVIVVVDSRRQNAGAMSYAGMNATLEGKIAEAMPTAALEARVGLVAHELVQPMDHPPLTLGSGGLTLVKEATPIAQPLEITKWLMKIPGYTAA